MGRDVRSVSFILLLCISPCIFVVLGYCSRALFIGIVRRRVARRVPDEVCVGPRLVHGLIGCICMFVCMYIYVCGQHKIKLSVLGLDQRNSIEVFLPLELAQAKCVWVSIFSLGRLHLPRFTPSHFRFLSLSLETSFSL